MRRMSVAALVIAAVLAPSLAAAHVGIRPRESKPGAEERYTVRVPTEGAAATTSVRVEIPDGVTVLDIERADGVTSQTETREGRIVAITWTKTIPPKEVGEFFFRARNPASTADLAWKAHQHFADGTTTDWVGPAGDRRPAPVTKLTPAAAQPVDDVAEITRLIERYDAAFNAKNLDALAAFYHPDVTIYEGGGINNGWADYRDHHLGPELKAFENLQFGHSNVKVTLLPGGTTAYVAARYMLKTKMGTREIDAVGLATMIFYKDPEGWRIRHSHTSSRARRPGE
ncbi:MAG: DUF1775 domain-containing protein [Acidobacteriota bacterium]